MPIQKRYFHCSQELNHDAELWEFTQEFGDRALRTWLQILAALDRSENRWRITGDWLGTLSRIVRQSSANCSRQIRWMVERQWLLVAETAADGSPLVLSATNWRKYHRLQERTSRELVPAHGTDNAPLLPSPSLSPSHPIPTLQNKNKKKKEEILSATASPCGTGVSVETWAAYAGAYRDRYGVDPVRNRTVNSHLVQVVERLGRADAPSVARFYVSLNSPVYVLSRHATNLLVRDCEGIRTQWATGVRATSGEVRDAVLRDEVVEQVRRVEALMARGTA